MSRRPCPMKNCLPVLLFPILLAACQTAPKDLGEQLDRDNPKLIAYLVTLGARDINTPGAGVRLYDGVELKDAIFLGSKHLPAKKQHIYLFKTTDGYRAYAWVDTGGTALSIPPDRSGSPGEDAYVLSGDIYTYPEVHPGDGVVILSGATPKWLAAQK